MVSARETTHGVLASTSAWIDSIVSPLDDANSGQGVSFADIDGDGDLDVYLTNDGQANKLFRNDGGLTFVDISGVTGDTGPSRTGAFADADGDGDLDLYLVNDNANHYFRNEGGGVFVDATAGLLGNSGNGRGALFVDIDGDGDLDIFLANEGQEDKLFLNHGNGVFTNFANAVLNSTGDSFGVAVGDVDNDGDPDIYLTRKSQNNRYYSNLGCGTEFENANTGPLGDAGNGKGAAFGDIDNDGDLDLFVVNTGESSVLMRNDGDGVFVDITTGGLADAQNGRSGIFGDIDNDGDLDLFLTVNNADNRMFLNDGAGNFSEAFVGLVGTGGVGAALGDIDNDGDLDIYSARNGAANQLILNNAAAAGNHWLHVRLEGTASNRDGVGAKVYITAAGLKQYREVGKVDGGLYSENSLLTEFGTDSATLVDTMAIWWPSGVTQLMTGIAVDTVLTIVEPMRVYNINQDSSFISLNDAIVAAANGDTLIAQPGWYREAIDFQGKAITLRSTNPEDTLVVQSTTIDAGCTGSTAVRFANGEGSGSKLEGFRILSGTGDLIVGSVSGGGLVINGASPVIRNCQIVGCSAYFGGGAYVGAGSNPEFDNCMFFADSSNSGGAIYVAATGAPNIVNCHFRSNEATYGGAIYTWSSAGSIDTCIFDHNVAEIQGGAIRANSAWLPVTNCVFDTNLSESHGGAIFFNGTSIQVILEDQEFINNRALGDGGAVWVDSATDLQVSNCRFIGNDGSRGAAIFGANLAGQQNTIKKCSFFGNQASPQQAGGSGSGTVYIQFGEILIDQCLFTGNPGIAFTVAGSPTGADVTRCTFANNGGGVLAAADAGLNLVNTILWQNDLAEVQQVGAGSALWSYCDVYGTGGTGGQNSNVDVDPLFVDADGGDDVVGTLDDDLHLSADSPLSDVGSGVYDSLNVETDLDGEARFSGLIDLGCYEFQADCDSNGTKDPEQISLNPLLDCNGNLVLDSCESDIDCNVNSILDICEIAANPSLDLNGNGFLDLCESVTFIAQETWAAQSVHVLKQDVLVVGSLTVEAGAVVRLAPGVELAIDGGAELVVNGTAEEPVTFTSANKRKRAGDWNRIHFKVGSQGTLNHIVVSYAGWSDPAFAMNNETTSCGVLVESAIVSISNSTITQVGGFNRPRLTASSAALSGGDAFGLRVLGTSDVILRSSMVSAITGGTGAAGFVGPSGEPGGDGLDGIKGSDVAARNGGVGGGGFDAGAGGPGTDGGSAVGVYCGPMTKVLLVNNEIRLIRGGAGGPGGRGGVGGQGGAGGEGRRNCVDAGDGGPGGMGGAGGPGGTGGAGGAASGIQFEDALSTRLDGNLVALITSGDGGEGGKAGTPGKGGDGGRGGDIYFGQCSEKHSDTVGNGGDSGPPGCCNAAGGAGGNIGDAHGLLVGALSASSYGLQQNSIVKIDRGSHGAGGTSTTNGALGWAGRGGSWFHYYYRSVQCNWTDIFWRCEEIAGTKFGSGDDGAVTPAFCSSCSGGIPGIQGVVHGILAQDQAHLTVGNSIVAFGDSASAIAVSANGNATAVVSYTTIFGYGTLFSGSGVTHGGLNSLGDPQFRDFANNDFHLHEDSPAVDTGNDATVPTDSADVDMDGNTVEPLPVDLDGNPRIFDGNFDMTATVDRGAYEAQTYPTDAPLEPDEVEQSIAFGLWGPDRNPFMGTTTIRYDLAQPTKVELRIYDVAGRLVRTLENSVKERGRYGATWDGRSDSGVRMSTGIYFCRLVTPQYDASQKMVLVR